MIDMLYGARNEIIGGIVLMLLAWCWHKFRVMLKKYKTMKHEFERMREEMTQIGATKEEHERLTAELQQKDEALSLSVTKAHEDSRLIEELRSQIEALQQEKAKKKIPPMSDSDFLKLCEAGNAKKVEEAIMNGANVNAKDNDGWTALMYAAWNGHTDTAGLLCKYGGAK